MGEAEYNCPFPGCGRALSISKDGKVTYSYEVALIDKKKAPKIDNLLALCPRCHATYLVEHNNKICKELTGEKRILMGYQKSVTLLDDLPIEKGIVGVILKVKNLKEKDLTDVLLDPKELKQKMSPADNFTLYMTVNTYVNTYYVRLREIMINLNKRGGIDYDEIQDQIHAIYKKLHHFTTLLTK